MAKKRVLIFIDWFLPGDKAGGPVRSVANLIDHLEDDYEFSVIARDTDYTETKPYANIQPDAWNTNIPGVRVYYISQAKLTRETISTLLAQTEYDHVYLNGIWSQPFTRWPLEHLKAYRKTIPVTIAVRGMLAPSAMAIRRLKKKTFLLFAKLSGLFSGVTFHATTAKEASEVRAAFGKQATVHVAGNLPRKNHHHSALSSGKRIPGSLRLVSIARIAPEKNTLYALEVLAKVQAKVEFDVWGAIYDQPYYAMCESAVKMLPGNVTVRFHGPLESEKIPGMLREHEVLFLPTRGENFGHIILEAMQAGLPVLISDQTPWKHLQEFKAGWDLPLENATTFAMIIDKVARMSEEELMEWKSGAKDFAGRYTGDEKLLGLNRNLFA